MSAWFKMFRGIGSPLFSILIPYGDNFLSLSH